MMEEKRNPCGKEYVEKTNHKSSTFLHLHVSFLFLYYVCCCFSTLCSLLTLKRSWYSCAPFSSIICEQEKCLIFLLIEAFLLPFYSFSMVDPFRIFFKSMCVGDNFILQPILMTFLYQLLESLLKKMACEPQNKGLTKI